MNRTYFKEYIGDSVYVQDDGYHVILTTENGLPGDPSNRIALEPSVLYALETYVKGRQARWDARAQEGTP
jgi:hypothetical protein